LETVKTVAGSDWCGSANPPDDDHEQFMLANRDLPERQKGNSLGQRPRKTHPDSFQPEGLVGLSHTFSVLGDRRGGLLPGALPQAISFQPFRLFR